MNNGNGNKSNRIQSNGGKTNKKSSKNKGSTMRRKTEANKS